MTERVITVGIDQFLLASATSGFSSYIKLAYCSVFAPTKRLLF